MNENESHPQLQMVWPERLLDAPPVVRLPPGYALRTYRPGDEARFFEIIEWAGWPGWDEDKLHLWLYRIVPEGWFMAVHRAGDEIVTTAMATHDPTWRVPFCGEVGWVAGDPAHSGRGLGMAVCAVAWAVQRDQR